MRELDCRLAARLREFYRLTKCVSNALSNVSARVLLLPSRLAPRHLPQRGRLFLTHHPDSSLPLGEMSRSDREGLIPASMFLKVFPDTNLLASYPLSHLLRKCQLSQRESQEAGANVHVPIAKSCPKIAQFFTEKENCLSFLLSEV